MEVKKSITGKRIWTAVQKQAILAELEQGFIPAEVARRHEINLQHLYRWRRRFQEGGETALRNDEVVVPASEVHRLEAEKKGLERALGEMTMERNILRDAVEIARKKSGYWTGGDCDEKTSDYESVQGVGDLPIEPVSASETEAGAVSTKRG